MKKGKKETLSKSTHSTLRSEAQGETEGLDRSDQGLALEPF